MPLRLVLDTNVWLDWLVFNDAGLAPVQSLVNDGKAEIIIDADCDAELVRVLDYPLPIVDHKQARLETLAAFEAAKREGP